MAVAHLLKFLNPLLSTSIAVKGLKKINPQIGSFITTALASGYTANQAIDFLRSKFDPKALQAERGRLSQRTAQGIARPDEMAALESYRQQEDRPGGVQNILSLAAGGAVPAIMSKLGAARPEDQNVKETIQNASPASDVSSGFKMGAGFIAEHPELGKFLDDLIAKGSSPEAAATMAKRKKMFKPIIANIEEKMGQDFPSIVSQIFGGAKQEQAEAQQTGGGMSQLIEALNALKRLRGG